MGGILSVPVVKIALSKAPEYPFLNPGTVLQVNANELLVLVVQLIGEL